MLIDKRIRAQSLRIADARAVSRDFIARLSCHVYVHEEQVHGFVVPESSAMNSASQDFRNA